MEVLEEGNLMDRVPILLQRDLEFYQVTFLAKKGRQNGRNASEKLVNTLFSHSPFPRRRAFHFPISMANRRISACCRSPSVQELWVANWTFRATHRLPRLN